MTESPAANSTACGTDNHSSTTNERYASIDIGTNSVKVWVADGGVDGFPETVHEEIKITKLGQDLSLNGSLLEEAIERTLSTGRRFVQIARDQGAQSITIAATSAVRQASNRDTFLSRARNELEHDVQVITGEQEADMTFSGVTYGRVDKHEELSVVDVGGGSTELMFGRNSHPLFQDSIPVGSVQLYEQLGWDGALTETELDSGIQYTRREINDHIGSDKLRKYSGSSRLFGVGGTVATIALVYLGLSEFSQSKIEGCRITRQEILQTSKEIFHCTPDERVNTLHVKPGRSEYIAGGAAVVGGVLDALSVPGLEVTCRGLRHGLLIDTFLQPEENEQ